MLKPKFFDILHPCELFNTLTSKHSAHLPACSQSSASGGSSAICEGALTWLWNHKQLHRQETQLAQSAKRAEPARRWGAILPHTSLISTQGNDVMVRSAVWRGVHLWEVKCCNACLSPTLEEQLNFIWNYNPKSHWTMFNAAKLCAFSV